MSSDSRLAGRSRTFSVAALAYVILWLAAAPAYRYQINPDGICYISIAQKYMFGDFSDAVNGYWGPLYSWLLIPLLLAKIEPLLAVRLLGLVLGLCVFGALSRLARDFALSRAARIAVASAAVPLTAVYSLEIITPDLLLAMLVLFYFHIVFRPAARAYGLSAGLIGGLAYLAKSYGLPFFLAHYAIANSIYFLAAQGGAPKRRIVRNFFSGLLVFAVVSGAWIAILTAQYGKLTFSTSGSFNMSKLDPAVGSDPATIVPPPNQTAVFAWEDPLCFDRPTWSPLRSPRDIAHYVGCIRKNVRRVHGILRDYFSPLSMTILVMYLLLLCNRRPWQSDPGRTLHPLIALILFCTGYILILVEGRYLWACCFLLLLMGGYCYDRLTAHAFFTKSRCLMLIGLFVCSFSLKPLLNLAQAHRARPGSEEHALTQVLKDYIRPGESIVSDSNRTLSIYLAYHLKARYFGYWGHQTCYGDEHRVEEDLVRHGIRHFLAWGGKDTDVFALPGYDRVHVCGAEGLTLYSRTDCGSDGEGPTIVSEATR